MDIPYFNSIISDINNSIPNDEKDDSIAARDFMNKFKNDNTQYKTDNLYMYFKVFNETTLYPIKSICRENLNILGLDE